MSKLAILLRTLDEKEGNVNHWRRLANERGQVCKMQYLELEAVSYIIDQLYNSGKISRDARETFYDMFREERLNIRENLMQ